MKKETLNKIKEEIKEKENVQRFYKDQRKTVKIKGERKIGAYEAADLVRSNTVELRNTYIAYYILKHGLDAPKFVDVKVSYGTRKELDNKVSYKEAIKGCCGENCILLKDDWLSRSCFESSAVRVFEIINEWKIKYQEPEAKEAV